MNEGISSALAQTGHLSESVEGDYGRTGLHHVHAGRRETIPEVAGVFREHGYFLEMVACVDHRHDLEKMRVIYTFNNFSIVDRHRIHVDLDPGQSIPSMTAQYAAADWMEREVYDMHGVVFDGHPDLKRILLPEDADFFPLLKDFGRIDEGDPESEVTDDDGEGD